MTTRSLTFVLSSNEKISFINDLFSLTKPRLSSLVIFTSALGLFLAPVEISFFKAFISILATSGLVGGACAINCYMEKDIDGLMERTKSRPLPSGRMSPNTALTFGLSLILSCLSILYIAINPLTALLGLTAAIVYIGLYTPLKTKTSWALFAGAIPGAIPPLMGWTSATNSFGNLGLVLFAILFIWQLPHFLSIAIYHAEDYKEASIKTHPGAIGIRQTVHRIAIYTYALFLISVIPYWIGFTSEGYRNALLVVGGAFFLYSLLGYTFEAGSKELLQWARRYFYGSLVYLPCVFILMIYFRYNS
ncbi:MAG TPA: heme o synthase [Bacteriovoracaceae bacterium]|nr:heme o synthase [Bacteriovoracaceae bacterium]